MVYVSGPGPDREVRIKEYDPVGAEYGLVDVDNPRSAYLVTDSRADLSEWR